MWNHWPHKIYQTLLLIVFSSHMVFVHAAESMTLSQAVAEVTSQNPGLAEIKARAEAMAAIPSQAGSLPDPVLSFSTVNLPVDSFNINQEAMTQIQFGLSQQIPYPGKLALQSEIADFEANAASSQVDRLRLQLVRDVKTLWWRLFYLDRALEVLNINKTLLRQFIDIAQTKYKVGEGLQQDVLLAQLELSKLLDREIQVNSHRQQESARINTLLNRPVNNAVLLPPLDQINVELSELKPLTDLISLAQDNQPALSEKQLLVEAARSRKALAERNLLPDFNVGAAYGFRSGNNVDGSNRDDLLTFRVGINLPLFAEDKQKMAISQRHSEVKQHQFALQDEWLRIQSNISTSMTDYQRAREQVSLFKTGIIPQARQTVASMRAGYQVNKVDFLNLVRAQITLYNYETRLWQTISEAKAALAQLTAAIGEDPVNE